MQFWLLKQWWEKEVWHPLVTSFRIGLSFKNLFTKFILEEQLCRQLLYQGLWFHWVNICWGSLGGIAEIWQNNLNFWLGQLRDLVYNLTFITKDSPSWFYVIHCILWRNPLWSLRTCSIVMMKESTSVSSDFNVFGWVAEYKNLLDFFSCNLSLIRALLFHFLILTIMI